MLTGSTRICESLACDSLSVFTLTNTPFSPHCRMDFFWLPLLTCLHWLSQKMYLFDAHFQLYTVELSMKGYFIFAL